MSDTSIRAELVAQLAEAARLSKYVTACVDLAASAATKPVEMANQCARGITVAAQVVGRLDECIQIIERAKFQQNEPLGRLMKDPSS